MHASCKFLPLFSLSLSACVPVPSSSLLPLQMEDLPSSDQGWFFSDFENDNVWLPRASSTSKTALLKGEIPPGLFSLARQASSWTAPESYAKSALP